VRDDLLVDVDADAEDADALAHVAAQVVGGVDAGGNWRYRHSGEASVSKCCLLFASKGVGIGAIRLASAWSSALSSWCCRVVNQTTLLRKPGGKGGRPGLHEGFVGVSFCVGVGLQKCKARRRLRAGSPGQVSLMPYFGMNSGNMMVTRLIDLSSSAYWTCSA
jgi:hypothetical protein